MTGPCRDCGQRPAGERDSASPFCGRCDPNGARFLDVARLLDVANEEVVKAVSMRHTPGPWHIRGGTEIGPDGRNFPVAQALSPTGPRWRSILSEAEIDANAHLIAASPDLYEALERIIALAGGDEHEPPCAWKDAFEAGARALAKAEGQS